MPHLQKPLPRIIALFALLQGVLCSCHFTVNAQTTDREAILEPVNRMFRAMETGDSALLRTAFYHDVHLTTLIADRAGEVTGLSRETELDGFLKAVAAPKQQVYREPIYNIKVNQEGGFAQVWADYAFYTGTSFHHCGVDTFQLIRTTGGWKIFYLADTRQKEGCKVPARITRAYQQ
ncbi:MAG: nuclear transport factor 2 family protein [Bacteroidota bacterium]